MDGQKTVGQKMRNFKSIDTCLLSPIGIAHKCMYVHVIKIKLTYYNKIYYVTRFLKQTKMSHKPIKDNQTWDCGEVIHQS